MEHSNPWSFDFFPLCAEVLILTLSGVYQLFPLPWNQGMPLTTRVDDGFSKGQSLKPFVSWFLLVPRVFLGPKDRGEKTSGRWNSHTTKCRRPSTSRLATHLRGTSREASVESLLLPSPCCMTRSPSSTLLPFLGEGSPAKTDYRKKGYPYSNLQLLEDLDEANLEDPGKIDLSVVFCSFSPRSTPNCRICSGGRSSGLGQGF